MGFDDSIEQAKKIIRNYQSSKRIEIDKPRWDQKTYWGRVQHFWAITNPMNLFHSDAELDRAKDIVNRYRRGENISNLTEDELWKQKHLYDSAFHPETGEKTFIIGRMSAQSPCNMLITGFMMNYYRTLPAVLFWQWVNQSFNATVNYCNRSGSGSTTLSEMFKSYASATTGAIVTAVGLNKLALRGPPIVGRLVPFFSVAAANAVNLPLTRQREIQNGIKIMDEQGETLGYSSKTAKIAITQVILSRCLMAAPTMVTLPIIMTRLEKTGFLKKYPRFPLPFQVLACGVILTFATPLGCAVFPQIASIPVSWIEPELQNKINSLPNPPSRVYYNKGL